ncbi:MAG: hypothetical protein J1E39_10175 [Eubacterium sp.]|nr:hypothetical protein [Eubacterium sp.]
MITYSYKEIKDGELSDTQKQEMIDRYNADKARSARLGAAQLLFCVIALAADAVLSIVFYIVCAMHPLVFVFLSQPNMTGGQAGYIPATVDTADPGGLFAIGMMLFIIAAVKLTLAICGIVFAARRIAVKPTLVISAGLFCFVDVIFSAIMLTYPQSYEQPVFMLFMIVNILLALATGACMYLLIGKRNIQEYLDSR